MAFDIEEFKARIEDGGILQTNKYDVQIYFPYGSPMVNALIPNSADGASSSQVLEDLSYRCIAASIPGVALRTSDNNRFGVGVSEKIPFSAGYTDVSLTFVCDRFGTAYNFWYTWFNYIFAANGHETQGTSSGRNFYTTEYKDNYAANIVITVYDTSGEPAIQTVLLKAFPISLNDVSLSWSDNNNLVKITANITFREWSLGEVQAQPALSVFGLAINTVSNIISNVVDSVTRLF